MKEKIKTLQEHYKTLLGHIFEYEYEEMIENEQVIEPETSQQKEQPHQT